MAPAQPSQEAAYQDGRQKALAFGSKLGYACLLPTVGVCRPGRMGLKDLLDITRNICKYIFAHDS